MPSEAITFGQSPRYHNIIGGPEAYQPTIESPFKNWRDGDARVWRFYERLKEDMRNSKNIFSQNFDYYYALFVGRQWVTPNKSGQGVRDSARPWYRSNLVVNYIFPVIDMEVAIIFDNNPKPYLSATSPDQGEYSARMQAGVDFVWEDQYLTDKLELSTQDAGIYGTSVLKGLWNPAANHSCGAIQFYNVAIENFYVDRAATSLHEGEYTAILELGQMPLSVIRRMYPDKAQYIRIDTGAIPYQERKEVGGFSGMGEDIPTQILSPGNAAGLFGENSDMPFTPAMGCEDYMIEVGELWIEDHSKKETVEQYRAGTDAFGRPIMASRVRQVDAYPNGRLITTAGGVVLQDTPSPYKQPPYVLIRHITLARRFWGIGVPELVGDQQVEINKRRSHLMDAVNSMGNPVWKTHTNAGIDPDMDLNEPGQVITYDTQYPLDRLAPPNMPQWIIEMESKPVGDIFSITGAGGALSNPAQGKRSGSAVSESASQANIRIRRRALQVDIAIKDITRIIIDMIQKFWTTPRWLMVMGSWGKPTPVPFDARHARGQWDIKVESGSAAASSKIARRQEAMQLFDKKVIGPLHLLDAMDWPNRDQIAKDMGYFQAQQLMNYQGWPGQPTGSPNGNANSGYSMQSRYQIPPPPAPRPMVGPQGGGKPHGSGKGHAPPKPPSGGFPFGKPTGIRAA